MEVDTTQLTNKELAKLGLCIKCKTKPRAVFPSRVSSYCTVCHNQVALDNYNNLKAGHVSNKGRTIELALLALYRYKAKKRGMNFNLTDAEAIDIMHQPCDYCKLPKSMG